MRRFLPFVALAISAACGSSTPEPASPVVDAEAEATLAIAAGAAGASAPTTKADAAAMKPVIELLTDCAEHAENIVSLPEARFVKRLCSAPYPNVALSMFQKATPWTRGYLRMNVEAWNAAGGLSSSEKLVFDEEVLVLRKRVVTSGGMRVSGSGGGYEVLRWDGTCASLNEEELTLKAPPSKAKFAKIPYRSLDEATRTALESNDKVGKAVDDRKRECQGAMGDPSPKCVKADEAVSGFVVDYLRAAARCRRRAGFPDREIGDDEAGHVVDEDRLIEELGPIKMRAAAARITSTVSCERA